MSSFFSFSISISETKIWNYDQVRCPNPSGMSRSQEAFHTCEVLSGHKSLSVEWFFDQLSVRKTLVSIFHFMRFNKRTIHLILDTYVHEIAGTGLLQPYLLKFHFDTLNTNSMQQWLLNQPSYRFGAMALVSWKTARITRKGVELSLGLKIHEQFHWSICQTFELVHRNGHTHPLATLADEIPSNRADVYCVFVHKDAEVVSLVEFPGQCPSQWTWWEHNFLCKSWSEAHGAPWYFASKVSKGLQCQSMKRIESWISHNTSRLIASHDSGWNEVTGSMFLSGIGRHHLQRSVDPWLVTWTQDEVMGFWLEYFSTAAPPDTWKSCELKIACEFVGSTFWMVESERVAALSGNWRRWVAWMIVSM